MIARSLLCPHQPTSKKASPSRRKFDANGLITAVATDAKSGDVLMVAHMNAEALAKTIASGEAWYYSRSRKALWKKGESSGHVQRVVELRVDCDQDALWLKVEQEGPGRLPHRAALVFLPRGSARPERRAAPGIPQCGQGLRPGSGLFAAEAAALTAISFPLNTDRL